MNPARALRRRFLIRIAILLTLAGAAVIALNEWSDRKALEEATLTRARAHHRDLVLTRRWNAEHGGVYVEKRSGTDSSPYLSNPDIKASNGKTYTLRNPAQMTREISELAAKDSDYRFHITSLKLKNPDNAADPWERAALEGFAAGEAERFATIHHPGRVEFRYMAPIMLEQSCLECHQDMGYRLGDVRGGISVSFDITALVAARQQQIWATVVGALLTIAGLFVLARSFARQLDQRLQRLSRRHEDLIQSIDGVVWEAEAVATEQPPHFTFISHEAEALTGVPSEAWTEKGFWAEQVHAEDRARVLDTLRDCVASGRGNEIEYRVLARDGRTIWIHDRIRVSVEQNQTLLRGLAHDVTLRHDQDEQLRQVLAEKESILDNALIGIVHLRERRVVACNRRFEELFGYAPGELVGESTSRLYDSEAAYVEVGERAYAALGRGSNYSEEISLRRKDGSHFWGALTGRAIDPRAPQEGSIWIYADVSERRRAEEEVHKLLRAVEQSPVSIVITNRDGLIEYVNPRFTRVTGYALDEVIGQNPRILQSGETSVETYREMWETVLAGFEWRGTLRNRRKNGELFWEEATISPILNENLEISHLLAVKEDVSERKRVESALLESYEAYLHLLETTLDGFLLIDAAGRILDVNAAYVRQSGYTHEQLLDLRIADLESAQTPSEIAERTQRIVIAGSDQFETVHRRHDGTLWDVEVSISYRASAGGQFFVFLRDISARKDSQRQLVDQHERLEELVARRTADLAAALRAATVADKAKDAFLANVSHELRTPLNAVIGLSGLALRNAADAKQHDTLKKIQDSGQTLLDLVNDLLDLSKITAGEMRFETMPFHLGELVARVRAAIGIRAAEKSLTLSAEIDPELPAVLAGDALRVEQILLNLLSNAIKFTPAGTVRLRIGADARDAQMVRLRIEVADSGIGMSEAEMARLFQPFAQADDSITRIHGGTGLGLAICKQLAEGMNGSIAVRSEPGKGSLFTVRLWLGIGSDQTFGQSPAEAAVELPRRYPSARVLVVDDQPLNREVVSELLATVGIVPVEASDGREALERVRSAETPFDLILMDIQMPVLDGLSATRAIRALPGCADLPIVAITAHTMVHEKAAYLAAGMSDHIGKPFATTLFYRMLARWLAPAQTDAQPAVTEPPLPPDPRPQSPEHDGERLRTALAGVAGLDSAGALERFSGNVARYRHWLQVFIDESPAVIAQVRTALSATDSRAAKTTMHAFKGRTGMLGMTSLHTSASALESAIQTGDDAERLGIQLDALGEAVDTQRQALQAALATAPAPALRIAGAAVAAAAEPPRVTGERPAAIDRLQAMLAAGDGNSIAALESAFASLGRSPWAPLLHAALEDARRFDFEAARDRLRDAPPPAEIAQ